MVNFRDQTDQGTNAGVGRLYTKKVRLTIHYFFHFVHNVFMTTIHNGSEKQLLHTCIYHTIGIMNILHKFDLVMERMQEAFPDIGQRDIERLS